MQCVALLLMSSLCQPARYEHYSSRAPLSLVLQALALAPSDFAAHAMLHRALEDIGTVHVPGASAKRAESRPGDDGSSSQHMGSDRSHSGFFSEGISGISHGTRPRTTAESPNTQTPSQRESPAEPSLPRRPGYGRPSTESAGGLPVTRLSFHSTRSRPQTAGRKRNHGEVDVDLTGELEEEEDEVSKVDTTRDRESGESSFSFQFSPPAAAAPGRPSVQSRESSGMDLLESDEEEGGGRG